MKSGAVAADMAALRQVSPRRCRFCEAPLARTVVDLGNSPLANSFLTDDDLTRPEPFYPLRVFICSECFLVQVEQFETPEHIFGSYLYFSSYSKEWLDHGRAYASSVREKYALDGGSQVVEI